MLTATKDICEILNKPVKAAPLAVFRILFGSVMLFSTIRFWYNGWIEKLYLDPEWHFHYYGFDFIEVPGQFTYVLFMLMGLLSIAIIIGYRHQLSMSLFFLVFTYVELMDKTTYLNHYYFVSVLSFLMIWLPMSATFSVDVIRSKIDRAYVARWSVMSIQVLICIVYVYAGIAKINYDWLFKAMPLTIWLPTKQDIPILGELFQYNWMHYAFSWGGAVYDLFIVFFLMYRTTRIWAFVLVLFFHITTAVLFPIGMFPYLMILAVLIFFSEDFHDSIIRFLKNLFSPWYVGGEIVKKITHLGDERSPKIYIVAFILILQVLVPLRGFAYPGNIFWTEQGYRFSWRVMLMEKTGYANFKIVDGVTGKFFYVQNHDFLTAFQQKEMSTQPDFIIEYAHMLRDHFASQGHQNIEIYVESYASLNGRRSQPFIDSTIDLTKIQNSLAHRDYIIPLVNEE